MYMSLMKRFGAVVGVGAGTLRKVFTIGLSFLVLPKPISLQHFFGLLVLIVGLVTSGYSKSKKSPPANNDREGLAAPLKLDPRTSSSMTSSSTISKRTPSPAPRSLV